MDASTFGNIAWRQSFDKDLFRGWCGTTCDEASWWTGGQTSNSNNAKSDKTTQNKSNFPRIHRHRHKNNLIPSPVVYIIRTI